jgi:serine/threonine protein kinase
MIRETRVIDYQTSPQSSLDRPMHPMTVMSSHHSLDHAIVNQYLVVKEIGEGSFSKVLLVFDTREQRYYACKTISKKRLRKKNLWLNGPVRKKRGSKLGKNLSVPAPNVDASANHPATTDGVTKNIRFDYMDMVRREIAILKRISHHPHLAMLVEVLDDETYDTLYMSKKQDCMARIYKDI